MVPRRYPGNSVRIIVQFGGTSVSTSELRSDVVARVREALDSGLHSVVVVSARAAATPTPPTRCSAWSRAKPQMLLGELDMLMSCGEIISAVITVNALRARGIDAVAMTGWQAGIHTDDNHLDAQIVGVEPDAVVRQLRRVVVVAGFQGITETGDITTLGRATPPLQPAASARRSWKRHGRRCSRSRDPRIVPEARTIEVVGHFEVCQMASEGAKVVHPRAVEIAMRSNVPRVKSTQASSARRSRPGRGG